MRKYLPGNASTPVGQPGAAVNIANLSDGARLIVWSLRQWVVSAHLGRCTTCDLARPYTAFSCTGALAEVQQFMVLLTREANRQIDVRHPREAILSLDEIILLRLVALSGRRYRYAEHLARRVVDDRAIDILCSRAKVYVEELNAVGLALYGWPEMQLVKEVD